MGTRGFALKKKKKEKVIVESEGGIKLWGLLPLCLSDIVFNIFALSSFLLRKVPAFAFANTSPECLSTGLVSAGPKEATAVCK